MVRRAIKVIATRLAAWCLTLASLLLTGIAPASAQAAATPWALVNSSQGVVELTSRREIVSPRDAGSAVLTIRYKKQNNPSVIVYLTIESPAHMQQFPFEKYDGPVEKTVNEFLLFEINPGKNGPAKRLRILPNGYYGVSPKGSFTFDTIDKRVVPFLSTLSDKDILEVTVNAPPNSIRTIFDTKDLSRDLAQMRIETAQSPKSVSRPTSK